MVFVTERHEFLLDGAVAVVEEQDFAYRASPRGPPRTRPTRSGRRGGTATVADRAAP